MNAKNTNLLKAKKEANDEFYTQYEDIAKEIEHYKEHLKGKVVYCNCDIPHFSNFHKYFLDNFKELELKKLIVTGYSKDGNGKCSIYDGEKSTDYDLLGDGDFRGDECVDMLQKADVVITNPPFSLFREFIKVVTDNDKDFIVIGNINAITYKEVFPLIKDNAIHMGKSFNKTMLYKTPYENFSDNNRKLVSKFGKSVLDGYVVVQSVGWFTSFNVRENDYLEMNKEYSESEYYKYHNYDAINVNKTKDIPKDYDGVMGVPITFLDKYNPKQFEILGLANDKRNKSNAFIQGESVYLDDKHKNFVGMVLMTENGLKATYARILIKRKH